MCLSLELVQAQEGSGQMGDDVGGGHGLLAQLRSGHIACQGVDGYAQTACVAARMMPVSTSPLPAVAMPELPPQLMNVWPVGVLMAV